MNRYRNIPVITSPNNNRMYSTVRYPEIPPTPEDTYVYTTIGDRFDTLAQQYYGNPSYWWIISVANSNLLQNSLTPPVGTQIRIPNNISRIIANFQNINSPTTVSSGGSGNSTNGY